MNAWDTYPASSHLSNIVRKLDMCAGALNWWKIKKSTIKKNRLMSISETNFILVYHSKQN